MTCTLVALNLLRRAQETFYYAMMKQLYLLKHSKQPNAMILREGGGDEDNPGLVFSTIMILFFHKIVKRVKYNISNAILMTWLLNMQIGQVCYDVLENVFEALVDL